MNYPNSLSADTAHKVFDLLLSFGANKDDRDIFVEYLTNYNGYNHEFRFMGEFGAGGKLRYSSFRGFYVTMYPEDSTTLSVARLHELNNQLRQINL